MKRFVVTTLLLAALGISTAAFADTRIAVVDVQAVVSTSAQVKALKKEQQAKLQELEKWLKTVKADVDKQQTKEGKEKLIKKYDAEFVKKQQDIKLNYAKKLQAIDENVTQAIANEAKAKGYNLVLSKQGGVLYSSDDLTANIQKVVK